MGDTQINSVTCNHCGAPLTIQPDTRFLTCAHCGSQLEVHRTGGALYTQVLESIDQRTQKIEQDVETLKRQNEVEQLDREWTMRREQLMVRDRDGGSSVPSAIGAIIGGAIMAVFGIIFATVSAHASHGFPGQDTPAFLPLIGLALVIGGIIMAFVGVIKSNQYRDAQERYERERARIIQQNDNPPARGS